jgi:dTDP-4-dehydrorhamnose reductase
VKVLLFGAAGQVGHEVVRTPWPASCELVPLDRIAGDITKPAPLAAMLAQQRPGLVINLAAYTAVDRAESEAGLAWAVNCAGGANLAAICGERDTPLIHLSTDYVFDGTKPGPYREEDPTAPLGVYGRSKEAGERAIRAAAERHIILRTSWVYGAYGANFVKTMLRLGAERPVLRVVADQRGRPTAAGDIAAALITFARHIEAGGGDWGTLHFAGEGAVSWHGFAEEIIELATRLGAWTAASRPRVEAITTKDYPTPARRPPNSVLDCRKITEVFGIAPPPRPASLAAVLHQLLEQNSSC